MSWLSIPNKTARVLRMAYGYLQGIKIEKFHPAVPPVHIKLGTQGGLLDLCGKKEIEKAVAEAISNRSSSNCHSIPNKHKRVVRLEEGMCAIYTPSSGKTKIKFVLDGEEPAA